ncbi:MAG: pyruvate kinase [Candidatus Omnitrophica bacterium]|nr:pyruvate kinase [Candidatus Omnitrophota bacterium]
MPKTKIICTLGPASSNSTMLVKMIRAGMDVVRLNFSHGTHEEHLARIRLVHQLNRKYHRHIRILGDLEGYRIRIGTLRDHKPVEVKKGQRVWLAPSTVALGGDVIPFDYDGPLKDIKKGQPIFIDDGMIALEAEGIEKKMLKVRVIIGGVIKEHKGVNIPDAKLSFKGVTAKDKVNLAFCLQHQVDFIAQSFVRSKADILALKAHIKDHVHQPQIIAKIEEREGIRNIDAIIAVCDGIMVARGDMGVSLPIWEVPMIQKAIIRKCNEAHKFVITATQMLESMTEERLPTRAEVTDVANAILDGTDYVMLSGESAVGVNPAGCVDMMNKIIIYTEKSGKL